MLDLQSSLFFVSIGCIFLYQAVKNYPFLSARRRAARRTPPPHLFVDTPPPMHFIIPPVRKREADNQLTRGRYQLVATIGGNLVRNTPIAYPNSFGYHLRFHA